MRPLFQFLIMIVGLIVFAVVTAFWQPTEPINNLNRVHLEDVR